MESIHEASIDDKKLFTPFRIEKSKTDGKIKTIYSDHNAITCKIKWEIIGKKCTNMKMIMTQASYKQFAKKMSEQNVSEIWYQNGTL